MFKTVLIVFSLHVRHVFSLHFFTLFVQPSGTGATVICNTVNNNINPRDYEIPNVNNDNQEGGTIPIGGGKRRRRRNALPNMVRRRLRKRQAMDVTEMQTTSNRTIVSTSKKGGDLILCFVFTFNVVRVFFFTKVSWFNIFLMVMYRYISKPKL